MNVGLDTYPIERMSSLEIEQAASAPFRLSKILDTGLARGRLPRSRKTRVLAAAGAFPNGAEFGAMELAPGGRWLFTLTIYGCIALWDLGTNKKVTALTRPTALWINPRRQGESLHSSLVTNVCIDLQTETSLSLLEVQVDYGVAHVLITCETPYVTHQHWRYDYLLKGPKGRAVVDHSPSRTRFRFPYICGLPRVLCSGTGPARIRRIVVYPRLHRGRHKVSMPRVGLDQGRMDQVHG